MNAARFIAALIMGSLIGLWLAPSRGYEPPPQPTWEQPYGGCDEAWQAPDSPGAQECREHGFVVKEGTK